MSEHGAHLIARHTRKPFKEVVHVSVIFEILIERCDRHTRPAEQPRAAVPLRIVLDRRA